MSVHLKRRDLDRLLPMSLHLDRLGRVLHVGPTLAKTRPDGHFHGRSLFNLFQFKRPLGLDGMVALRQAGEGQLRLSFRDEPHTPMRGLAVATEGDGVLLSLSFGISILDAIRHYNLTSNDFAPTDQTLDILYLIEAGNAAMEESQDLNRRLQGAKIAAEEQAFTDTLTGLKNRRAFDHVLARYSEQGVAFTLLGIDLDHFKTINDTLGHGAGDHVLQQAARIMVGLTDPADTIVRAGGDEFLLVLRDLTDPTVTQRVAERLIRRLEEPIPFEASQCRISASVGYCSSAQYADWDLEQMLQDVDAALYRAKRSGRGRAVGFEPGMDVAGPAPAGSGTAAE